MKYTSRLALVALSLVFCSCGSSSSFDASGANQNQNQNQSQTATVVVQSRLLPKEVPADIQSFRFLGQDENGQTTYGPVERPKASSVQLDLVPISTQGLRIEYLRGREVAGVGLIPLELVPGGTVTVEDANFGLTAQLVSDLQLTPQNPTVTRPARGEFSAFARLPDRAQPLEVTSYVSWHSSNRQVATISNDGEARTLAPGQTTISVAIDPDAAVLAGSEANSQVINFDILDGIKFNLFAFAPTFRGGVRVASADVDGDGVPEMILGAGPGGAPRVRVLSGATGLPLYDFLAFPANFSGGVYVAGGDVDGDGHADIVVGIGEGGPAQVNFYSGRNGNFIQSLEPFAKTFTGGVRVATGDLNDDGHADLIVGAGRGGDPVVKTYDGPSLTPLLNFLAYPAGSTTGGVYVATGDVDGDGQSDIVTGAGGGITNGPLVKLLNGQTGEIKGSFFAYDTAFRAGVRVAAGDITGDGIAEIVTAPGPDANSKGQVKYWDGSTLLMRAAYFPFGPNHRDGVFVAAQGSAHRLRANTTLTVR